MTGFGLPALLIGTGILAVALAGWKRAGGMSASSSSFYNRLNAAVSRVEAESSEQAASRCYEKLGIVRYGGKPGEEGGAECTMCLCRIEDSQEIRDLRCEHLFHRACLDEWLRRRQDTCPICRRSLLP